jgi:hypothetical protein
VARGDVDGTAIIIVLARFRRRKAAANMPNSREQVEADKAISESDSFWGSRPGADEKKLQGSLS